MSFDEEVAWAIKNTESDPEKLAHYLYVRCCEFFVDHEKNSEALMAAMIRALAEQPQAQRLLEELEGKG